MIKEMLTMNVYAFHMIVGLQLFSLAVLAEEGALALQSNTYSAQQHEMISITTNKTDSKTFRVGEDIDFTISVSQPLFVHCFYVSGSTIIKIHPDHSYGRHGVVMPTVPDQSIKISDYRGQLQITAPTGKDEVACLASAERMLYKIPEDLSYLELFAVIDYESVAKIYEAFQESISAQVYYQSISFDVVAE